MNQQNKIALTSLINSVDDFIGGKIGIENIQGRLQSTLDRLERGELEVDREIRSAEGDLEEIQFTMLMDEQRSAAVFRLDALRAKICDELGIPNGSREV